MLAVRSVLALLGQVNKKPCKARQLPYYLFWHSKTHASRLLPVLCIEAASPAAAELLLVMLAAATPAACTNADAVAPPLPPLSAANAAAVQALLELSCGDPDSRIVAAECCCCRQLLPPVQGAPAVACASLP